MNKKTLFGGIIVLALILVLIVAIVVQPERGPVNFPAGGQEAIAVVFVEGLITGDRGEDFFSVASGAYTVMDKIRQAKDDPDVAAVVVRINSPGGSAAASQEIGEEIQKLRATGKIVVASMGDTAASGGYWVASQADKIMANPATITGSIGVIMQTTDLQELYEKIGLDTNTFKSGPHKDMGSPNRPLTPEEEHIFQDMVDGIYQQFVDVVAQGRNLSREEVERLADGRVYTGSQAKELGLVDELGNYYDALNLAKQLAGIEGEPQIKSYERISPFSYLLTGMKTLVRIMDPAYLISPREIIVR